MDRLAMVASESQEIALIKDGFWRRTECETQKGIESAQRPTVGGNFFIGLYTNNKL